MTKMFEGVTLILKKDFTMEITPIMNKIKLSAYDIESFFLNYDNYQCGESDKRKIEITPEDFFDFIINGGINKIKSLKEQNEEIKKKHIKLKIELKKYQDVIGNLKK